MTFLVHLCLVISIPAKSFLFIDLVRHALVYLFCLFIHCLLSLPIFLSLSLSLSIFVSVNLIYVLTLLFLFRYVNECLTCLCIFLKNSSGSNSVFFSSMRNGNKIPWRRFWIVIQSYLGAIGSNSSKACGRFPIVFYFYRCSEIMTLLKKYKLVYHRK